MSNAEQQNHTRFFQEFGINIIIEKWSLRTKYTRIESNKCTRQI